MSSKSRKASQKAPTKSRAHAGDPHAQAAGGGAGAVGRARAPAHDDDDEIVHVPKGKSRLQFVFIIGLMVFTLIIFTVGSQFVTSVGSGRGTQPYLVWQHPVLGEQVIETADFFSYKRAIDDFHRVAMGGRFINIEDADVAVEVIHDALARQAGITITKAELASAILEGLPGLTAPQISGDFYRQNLEMSGITSQRFEEVLRRKMRVARWEQMHMIGFALPSPEGLEAKWMEFNQEYAYDYVEIEHAALMDRAAAELPSDEELSTWYDEQPQKQLWLSDAFKPARSRPEVVAFLAGGEPVEGAAAGLLALYPFEGTPEEAEQAQRDYYITRRSVRFKRPEPLQEGEEGFDDPEVRMFLPFEEVQAQIALEAEVLRCMRAWLADKKLAQSGGEAIDLAAEAEALGLTHWAASELMTREEIEAVEGWGSPYVSTTLVFSPVDAFTNDVIVGPGALVVGRVNEKVDAAPPAFDEVRDRIVERWKEQQVPELARAELQALRDALFVARAPTEPDPESDEDEAPDPGPDHEPVSAEAFAAAATAAGLTVGRRDWLRLDVPLAADPDWESPAHTFLREQDTLVELDEGELTEVLVGPAGERSYLVRSAGSRDPEEVDIDPGTLDILRAQVGLEQYIDFRELNMTVERYAEKYGLKLSGSEVIPEPGEAGA